MLIKKTLSIFFICLFIISNTFTLASAVQEDLIFWGEVKTGVYDFKFPIVNENMETTGFDLQTQKMTKNKSAVDFHINSHSANNALTLWAIDYMHGGRALYDQELTDPVKRVTQVRAELNAVAKDDLEPGDLILLVTSEDTFAKIKIDKITPGKVYFSYVLESDEPEGLASTQMETKSQEIAANDYSMIYWGEVKTGVYDFKFPIVNENMETTGFDLQTQKMTKNRSAVDFHINNHSANNALTLWAIDYMHGGKALYDQELTDSVKRVTQVRAELNAVAKDDLEPGDLILLVTSEDTFAKIKIDKITPGKVYFSYVLEADS